MGLFWLLVRVSESQAPTCRASDEDLWPGLQADMARRFGVAPEAICGATWCGEEEADGATVMATWRCDRLPTGGAPVILELVSHGARDMMLIDRNCGDAGSIAEAWASARLRSSAGTNAQFLGDVIRQIVRDLEPLEVFRWCTFFPDTWVEAVDRLPSLAAVVGQEADAGWPRRVLGVPPKKLHIGCGPVHEVIMRTEVVGPPPWDPKIGLFDEDWLQIDSDFGGSAAGMPVEADHGALFATSGTDTIGLHDAGRVAEAYAAFGRTRALNYDLCAPDGFFWIEDGALEAVVAEHVVEHLPAPCLRRLFSDLYAKLRPGGQLRISTPDLTLFARQYLDAIDNGGMNRWIKNHAHSFPPMCCDWETWPNVSAASVVNDIVRNYDHVFIWDEGSLTMALEVAGIPRTAVARSSFRSLDVQPDLARFDTLQRAEESLYLAVVKPDDAQL